MSNCRQCVEGSIQPNGMCDMCGHDELQFIQEYDEWQASLNDPQFLQEWEEWQGGLDIAA